MNEILNRSDNSFVMDNQKAITLSQRYKTFTLSHTSTANVDLQTHPHKGRALLNVQIIVISMLMTLGILTPFVVYILYVVSSGMGERKRDGRWAFHLSFVSLYTCARAYTYINIHIDTYIQQTGTRRIATVYYSDAFVYACVLIVTHS